MKKRIEKEMQKYQHRYKLHQYLKYARQWLEDVRGEVFEIGAGEFKESGTSISTMAVVINK